MSRLILVRHGQASFLSDDYDKLSSLGVRQARRLGKHWHDQGLTCDAVFCGPRLRHRETAASIQDCFHRAGQQWPDAVVLPELDEHHVDQLVMKRRQQLASYSLGLRGLVAALDTAENDVDKHREFQRLFEAAALLWAAGESFDVEPWVEFQTRVGRALDDIVGQPGRGRTVAVFTSVGPVTVAVQRALQCSDQIALQTGWRLWNCSTTEFAFSGERFTLDCFNSLSHLSRTEWTYR